ncbi:hypothetical protein HO133_003931 [Letharia lupina]|uniref:Uncharacterized protein n=1 Tax=Letharia lupina TaxID=560253 RepID=A0A8H6C9R0_9LECA|nr:uncharacterized protein HO133_003931 [Letharia lupina]KAF6219464.1 hypothetical protein HO133_003931 [Letharia lupina]
MSFGYGVGDIIAVSTLARTIWGRFRDASDQFNAIQTDVFGLHRVLDDIANNLSGIQLTDKQADDLPVLIEGCRGVLHDTEKLIRKNESLGTESSGVSSRTQKALRKLKWDSATVNELRDRMISSTTFLNAFNTSLASQASRATNQKVDSIIEDTHNLRLNQNQQERNELLQWLSPLNFAPQQSDLSNRRQKETGSWLLGSHEFQEWVNKEGKTLVCQGMPGAGKTMLASLVIDRLQQIPGEENVVTAYIYCDYKRQDEQTPINLTASVTKQLLQHQDLIPENILKMYQHHQKMETRPTFEEVLEMTGSSMARLSRVYVILDALDELGNAGQVRQTLIGRLRPLQDLHHFNLMTTSRYIPSLALNFHHPLCMDVRASPEDIRRYVEGHTSDLPKCVRESTGLQEAIATAIVDSVEGMFLLAQLHMDSLKDKTSSKLIKKALEILPKGSNALDLAYDGAMQRIENQMEGFRLLAKQLLGWLTYSERLMTVKEVQHALAIEPGTREFDEDNLGDIEEVLGFCAGLIIVDEETQIIRLVHYTTQEYFRRNGDRVLACAKQDIAISCLTYLLYENFKDGWANEVRQKEFAEGNRAEDTLRNRDEDEGEEDWDFPCGRSVKARLQKYPFLEYAARYWATHARLCKQQNVKILMMSFAKDDHRVSSASQVLLVLDGRYSIFLDMNGTMSRSPLSAMHIIAYFGYAEMISQLLNHGFEADAKDHFRRTPLWWAASQGHHGVVELLLSQSHVNVNNRGLFTMFGRLFYTATPLGIAAQAGKDETVKLLIEREDVDVNLPGPFDSSPLSSAAKEGHSTVVELLLTRRDIVIDSGDDAGQTPLWLAAAFGRADVVTQLLKHENVQINSKDHFGDTPLTLAASFGQQGIVEILLGCSDIEVNTQNRLGFTPLLYAVRAGWEAVVKLLLSHSDIDVNTQDRDGRTPLLDAVHLGHEAVVKLLLSHSDIDVNAKENGGVSPLASAVIDGNAAIVRLLCAHPDVDLDTRDNEGRDVLALVKETGPQHWKSQANNDALALRQEECLEILRTAIEARSRNGPQNSEVVPS